MKKSIIIVFLLFFIKTANAITSDFTHSTVKQEFDVFPVSTEMQIGKLQPLIAKVAAGYVITVGGERGFRVASMMPNVTNVVILDISDAIIRFNKINLQLLKAPTRAEYLALRWDAPFEKWQAYNLTESDFSWWVKQVRDIKAMDYKLPESLNKFQKSPTCNHKGLSADEKKINLAEIIDYKAGNYLFDDNLYDHIHNLALQNRITIAKINLKDQTQVQALVNELKAQQAKIAVLDLDNLYYETYMGNSAYQHLLQSLLPLGDKNSLLLVMWNYKDYACGQFQIYLGFTFENVAHWQQPVHFQFFFESLPKEVKPLIDGRLYEKNDRLPCFKHCKK